MAIGSAIKLGLKAVKTFGDDAIKGGSALYKAGKAGAQGAKVAEGAGTFGKLSAKAGGAWKAMGPAWKGLDEAGELALTAAQRNALVGTGLAFGAYETGKKIG